MTSDVRLPSPAPFLKWAGGKGQLLDQIKPRLPKTFNIYFEPFLGGGALFFRTLPESAILADSNPELINVFRVVRDEPEPLMYALDLHYPERTSREHYYKMRAMKSQDMSDVERAARTIFLNKTCYNGLYRVNSRGEFNVPFGKYKNPTLYDRGQILSASRALRGKIIDVCDYRDSCALAGEGDFVYFDPPYQPVSPTARFTDYTKESFTELDQKELATVFKDLDTRGSKVMISNSATPMVRSLYHGFRIEVVRATRAINSNAAGRGRVDEVLVTNY